MKEQIRNYAKQKIKEVEGLRLDAYYPTREEEKTGRPTIGYGFYNFYPDNTKILITDKITRDKAESLFDLAFEQRESFVKNLTKKNVETNDFQLYALVIFCYQFGFGNFSRSELLQLHNEKKYKEAALCFVKKSYCSQKGVLVNGLKKRREIEQALYRGKMT